MDKKEHERLFELRKYSVLDTSSVEAFDRITRLACSMSHVPAAVISLQEDERARFISRQGIELPEAESHLFFSNEIVRAGSPLVVNDAEENRFLVEKYEMCGLSDRRFVAGVPLTTAKGYNLGALSVFDHIPHTDGESLLPGLADLAVLAVDELEVNLRSICDPLTSSYNRQAFEIVSEAEMKHSLQHGSSLSMALLTIDNFKYFNHKFGHDVGDAILRNLVAICSQELSAEEEIFRIDEDSFAVLLIESDLSESYALMERVRSAFARSELPLDNRKISNTVAIGLSRYKRTGEDSKDFYSRASIALSHAMVGGGNMISLGPVAARVPPSSLIEKMDVTASATLAEIEQKIILRTLENCGQNRTHAAKRLGISIRTLRNRLRQYNH